MLLAVFPFIPFSIGIAIYRYAHNWEAGAWVSYSSLLLVVILLIAAWTKDFPRWSYPYAFLILWAFLAVLVSHDSDMTLVESLIFRLEVLGPFTLLFASVWLFTRHLRPLPHFFQHLRQDGTLFSLCIYSLLPYVIFGIFSGMPISQAAPFLAAATLVSAAGAALFMLLPQARQRLALLGICLTLSWSAIALGSASTATAFQIDGQHVIWWAVMLGLVCAPLLFKSVRREIAHDP
jgi:hypothetical protein